VTQYQQGFVMKLLLITPLKSICSHLQQRWCSRTKDSEKNWWCMEI